MEIYSCRKCGSLYNFVLTEDGRYYDRCGAPIEHRGTEAPYWGDALRELAKKEARI